MDAVTLQQRFIENVNRLLEERGWSRVHLAELMECSPGFVTDYLGSKNGGPVRCSPGLEVVARFATALEVDPSELLVDSSRFAVPT